MDTSKHNEEIITLYLFRLMGASSLNAIEIATYKAEQRSLMEGSVEPIGVSLNPVIALFNHSCDPNMLRVQNGPWTIGIANRIISKGEEVRLLETELHQELIKIGTFLQVSTIYSSGFWKKESQDRISYLENKYNFQCSCPPCLNLWPTNGSIPKGFEDLMPKQLKIDDPNPKQIMYQIQTIQKFGSSINLEIKNGNYDKAFQNCTKFIQELESTLERPHYYYLMAEKSLYKLSNIIYGTTIIE